MLGVWEPGIMRDSTKFKLVKEAANPRCRQSQGKLGMTPVIFLH